MAPALRRGFRLIAAAVEVRGQLSMQHAVARHNRFHEQPRPLPQGPRSHEAGLSRTRHVRMLAGRAARPPSPSRRPAS